MGEKALVTRPFYMVCHHHFMYLFADMILCYLHYTDEETEAQRGEVNLSHTTNKQEVALQSIQL